jgi:hypothetical protein
MSLGKWCGARLLLTPGSVQSHWCKEPQGHEPHWHVCSCGKGWRPERRSIHG